MSQRTDLSEVSRRRAAIGKGLRCLPLDETQLQKALGLWDQLVEAGNLAIPHYVDMLTALLRLSDNERHMARLSILREMITASLDPHPRLSTASEPTQPAAP